MEDGVQLPTFFDDLETLVDELVTDPSSNWTFVAKAPSLIALCTEEFKNQILLDDFCAEELSSLPPHLFEPLVMSLPAAALENLDQPCKFERESKEIRDIDESSGGTKRFKRPGIFDEAWRKIFETRFLMDQRSLEASMSEWESSDDLRQAYWQRHLQGCLDYATEQVFQPYYKGDLCQMHASSYVRELIGYKDMSNPSVAESMMMSYHFQQFGKYARCLKIRNVICTRAICDILKYCELISLIFRRIGTDEVDALCDLLKQNMRSLKSLHFIDVSLSSTDIERICSSLCSKELGMHLLQDLVIILSRLPDPNGCEPFLLLGRSLRSVSLSQNVICQEFAESMFCTLVKTSSSIEALNLSENSISGWLTDLKNISPLKSLSSLHKLVLRGNNMRAKEIGDLKFALRFLPNLDALDLSDNPIKEEGIMNLISCILEMAERNTFLKHLKLKKCGFYGAAHILETLSSLTNQLLSLSIADNPFGSEIAVPLGRFLCTPIQNLDIERIGFGSMGFKRFGQQIGKHLQLETINISRNRGKSTTAYLISKLISNAPRLKIIHASQNLMPPESMLEVCSTLKRKKGASCASNLELVDLSLNTYSPSLDAVRKEFMFEETAKPLVILPTVETSKIIHDHDP